MDEKRHTMKVLATLDQVLVETDGRTLWVNSGICLARLSPVSFEVFTGKGHVDIGGPPDYDKFAMAVKQVHDIDMAPYRSALLWLPT